MMEAARSHWISYLTPCLNLAMKWAIKYCCSYLKISLWGLNKTMCFKWCFAHGKYPNISYYYNHVDNSLPVPFSVIWEVLPILRIALCQLDKISDVILKIPLILFCPVFNKIIFIKAMKFSHDKFLFHFQTSTGFLVFP